eukprot:Sdes_comp18179_c0_seq1m7699
MASKPPSSNLSGAESAHHGNPASAANSAAGSAPSTLPPPQSSGFPGAIPSGFMNMPDMNRVQQDMMNNPQLYGEIMETPMMQSIMSNPELMREMIMSNPDTRAIMEQNPELAQAVTNPEVLRSAFEAMRNPGIREEMMRQSDRQLANISNSSQGYNQLRNIFQNVHEPLMNSLEDANRGRAEQNANPFAALAGRNSTTPNRPSEQPVPNPWAPQGAVSSQNHPSTQHQQPPAFGNPLTSENPLQNMQSMNNFMTQQMLNNPSMMEQMMRSHERLSSNPRLLQALQDPANVQALIQFQQSVAQLQRAGILDLMMDVQNPFNSSNGAPFPLDPSSLSGSAFSSTPPSAAAAA